MSEPRRDRPLIPAGYKVSTQPDGMLTWERVTDLMAAADIYWVATVRPDGRPHLIPVHAASVDGHIHLGGDLESRWVRNLAANPALNVSLDHGGHQVMVRGKAEPHVPAAGLWQSIRDNIGSKYSWQFDDEPLEMWEVAPETVIAFDLSTDSAFQTSPTRFTFEGAA